MENWTIALIVFAVTAGLSALLVAKSIPLYRQLGLLDQVGPRKVHTSPVPRGAGVATPMLVANEQTAELILAGSGQALDRHMARNKGRLRRSLDL